MWTCSEQSNWSISIDHLKKRMITFRICYLSLSFRMIRIVIVIHDDQVDHMWNISQIVKPTGCEPELHWRRMWERRRFRQGWIHWLISQPPISIFLGPRGPLVEPSIFPSCPPVRNNFSWVHRWAVTLPSGLRYPTNRIFYESWWCQLSKFGQKYKYKDKYRDKYKYRDK